MSNWLRSTLAAKPVAELGTDVVLALVVVVGGVAEESFLAGDRGRTPPGDCKLETVAGRPREGSVADEGSSEWLLLKRAEAEPFESLLETGLGSREYCDEGAGWEMPVEVWGFVLETPDSLSIFLIKPPNILPVGLCCILLPYYRLYNIKRAHAER